MLRTFRPIVSLSVFRALEAKRILDLGLLGLFLPLWLPLLVGIAGLCRLTGPGPVLHGQWRVGRGGRVFYLWKFRTMVPDANLQLNIVLQQDDQAAAEWQRGAKLVADPRVTPMGRLFRRYSLDELPQIWNVFRGEMSLVGPRPVPMQEFQNRYHGTAAEAYLSCRPGLSGLWQVSGRNALSYRCRLSLDCHYAKHRSIWFDMVILWRTLGAVMRGTGC